MDGWGKDRLGVPVAGTEQLPHVLHAVADPEPDRVRRQVRRVRPHVLDAEQPVVGRPHVGGRRDARRLHRRHPDDCAVIKTGRMGLRLEQGRADVDRPERRHVVRSRRASRAAGLPRPDEVSVRRRVRADAGAERADDLRSPRRQASAVEDLRDGLRRGRSARRSRSASTGRSTTTSCRPTQILTDAKNGTLPAYSVVLPSGRGRRHRPASAELRCWSATTGSARS